MNFNFKNIHKYHLIIALLGCIVIVETIILFTKNDKFYTVRLMPISHDKDTINTMQLKEDLSTLDKYVRNAQAFLAGKGIKNNGIEALSQDSISSLVYLAKHTNRYSEQLVELEQKLQLIPLGLPTTAGRISSNFGNRINPIPPKKSTAKQQNSTTANPTKLTKPVLDTATTKTLKVVDNTTNPPTITMQTVPLKPNEIKAKKTKYEEQLLAYNNSLASSNKAITSATKSNKKETNKLNKTDTSIDVDDLMQFHKGMDIAIPFGSPIKCTAEGTVVFAGQKSGYGTCVIISHGNGLATLYAHLSKTLVKANDKVTVGEEIAKSGNSGRSTGPHLHYEVHKNGTPVNPKLFLGW